MKNKSSICVGTAIIFIRSHRGKIDTPSTKIYNGWIHGLNTGTSLKCVEV
jgi:hypothetical protein